MSPADLAAESGLSARRIGMTVDVLSKAQVVRVLPTGMLRSLSTQPFDASPPTLSKPSLSSVAACAAMAEVARAVAMATEVRLNIISP